MFGRRRSASADYNQNNQNNVSPNGSSGSGSGGMFSRNRNNTGSLNNARSSMRNAEQAEAEAIRHLEVARNAVAQAKNHVAVLEREADEECVDMSFDSSWIGTD